MKKAFFLFTVLFFITATGFAQYWQQKVDYKIDVTLHDFNNTLDGFERITYTNNSPDTLTYIWFHLWPNAYKNDQTAFSNQLLKNGNTRFYFSSKEQKGYINRLDFKVSGLSVKTQDHPQHIDIIKIILPKPLPPLQQLVITTPFHVKLPYNFSRGGYDGNTYQLSQWYPKPAVYDKKGWHPMPYLHQGEFYSEFGDYEVQITLPAGYVVAATGVLQNEEEKVWMRNLKRVQESGSKTSVKKYPSKTGQKKEGAPVQKQALVSTKTVRFTQNNIHDFALFADKNFIVSYDTCTLSSGKIIDVYTYYTPTHQKVWNNSIQFCKDALRFYSANVGEYPYPVVSAVQGPESFGGGMEYPTITIISPAANKKELDITIAHEVGHNWFYGILASNERDHPWMDEGINTFYEKKYTEAKYGKGAQVEELFFQTLALQNKDQPMETASENFNEVNYGLVAYYKTAQWMKWLEQKIGVANFVSLMHQYFDQWKFKHPQPEDFKAFLQASLGKDAGVFFSILDNKGILLPLQRSGFKTISPLKKGSIKNYLQNPSKEALVISPAAGFNSYDKLMIGGIFTNYKLPPSPLQFFAAPLYATGSKSITGIGNVSYSHYPKKGIQKFQAFLNGVTFSNSDYTDSRNNKTTSHFYKIVPGVEVTFKQKDPHSTLRKYGQLKGFFIHEQPFAISFDSVITAADTTIVDVVKRGNLNYNVVQALVGVQNNRALYPYDAQVKIEGAQQFVRLSLTGNYFFNYAKEGGLALRFFAGKFFYDQTAQHPYGYNISRFFLNMTGANGEEDYTYSTYFAGRNKFEGAASQQIMIRDGGFKFRTDLLGNKVGKSDNWLMAINLTSTIPDNINPLSKLPVKIPLKLFTDIGTYAEAWKGGAEEDHFLFDAGVQISLLKETINIYVPLFYSRVYDGYYKSYLSENRFLKKISFSINFYNKTVKDLQQQLLF